MHPAEHDTRLLQHRNKAIEDLYNSAEFNECINKMEPQHLREDLKQEVALILMEKDPELIVAMSNRNELRWFVVRTILNMVCSNRSGFVKQYRKTHEECNADHPAMNAPDMPINGRVMRELREDPAYLILKKLRPLAYQKHPEYVQELYPTINWYEQYIVSLYMRVGGFRGMEKHTKIPWESCYSTVRKVMKIIRKEVLDVQE